MTGLPLPRRPRKETVTMPHVSIRVLHRYAIVSPKHPTSRYKALCGCEEKQSLTTSRTKSTMKAFLITFLAGLACATADPTSEAEAEAKPWFPYGHHGVGYPYGNLASRSYGYHAGVPLAYNAYGARPYYTSGHYIGKREAEAVATPGAEADPEAEADAWLATYGYGHPYPYAGLHYPYQNVLPTVKKVEKVDAKPVVFTHQTYGAYPYGAYPYGVQGVHRPLAYSHHIGKREAEATPEAEADPWLSYGSYSPYNKYSGYTYGYGQAPYRAYQGYQGYHGYPFYG